MAQKQKAVVLFSGGVDSTTCLALAIERFGKDNVVPLSIQYGQKHSKELEAAVAILEHYGIEGKTMDVTKLFAFSNCSLLTPVSYTHLLVRECLSLLDLWIFPLPKIKPLMQIL